MRGKILATLWGVTATAVMGAGGSLAGASVPPTGTSSAPPTSTAGWAGQTAPVVYLPQTTAALDAIGATPWRQLGWDGLGVVVAVVDTGFAGWDGAARDGLVPVAPAGDQRSGDIDRCDRGLADRSHGTDSATVIHHVAPKAELIRVCVDDAADLAAATSALIERGDVDIVNMALGFYNGGPGDGSGETASPDDSARRAIAAGMVWVNAAGNEAQRHHRALFTDADADGMHEFAMGDELGRFTVPPGAEVEIFLRWSQWDGGMPTDSFRLCLTVSESDPLDCVVAAQPERATPTTGLALTNPRSTLVSFSLGVMRVRGTGMPRLDLFFTEANGWEFPDAAASLVEPAAVDGVLSVGAACSGGRVIHPAGSQGPTLDGRTGVSLVGPAGTVAELAAPGFDCRRAAGATAVAAPYVSGAVALLAEAFPDFNGAQLRAELLARAEASSDPGAPGADPIFGSGMVALGAAPPLPAWPALPAPGPPLGASGAGTAPNLEPCWRPWT